MPSINPPAGQAATGANFFDRPNEIRRIWEGLESGAHLLIAAPRRVGKTSILLRLSEMERGGFLCVYVITQSADSQSSFFKRLFRALFNNERIHERISAAYKAKAAWCKMLDSLKGVTVAGTGVEFQDSADADYHDEFRRLVRSLPIEMPRIVLLVDEFPDTLMNIEQHSREVAAKEGLTQTDEYGRRAAVSFLQTCRELRQDPEIKEKILFAYTGSVGLENVVSQLGVPEHINDLQKIEIRQLTAQQARHFITATKKPFALDEPTVQALIEKVGWLIPYHIVVVLKEMEILWDDEQPNPVIDAAFIDRAFDSLIRQRNYFEFWESRLNKTFEADSCAFAETLLSELSRAPTGVLPRDRINSLATECGLVEEQRRYVLRTLIHDGYINNNDDPALFRFSSPLLRLWWLRNIAEF